MEYGHTDALMEGVIKQHRMLRGVPPCTAEEHYIQAAQQLDGYGQELFQAVVRKLCPKVSEAVIKSQEVANSS